jgi:aryl-alcohol dehydrogenase-like predicted oxidoreductase
LELKNKVAIGSVQFGLDYGISNHLGQSSRNEVKKILDFAAENQISLIDTAQSYGNSEDILGNLHDDRFDFVTKLSPAFLKRQNTKEIIKYSLERLRVKSIYGILFHDPESAFQAARVHQELNTLKEAGIVKKTGYSVYTPKELERLISKYGLPDIIQIPFSHLDRRFENFSIELKAKGVEIHTRSTFLQGLYFMNPNDLSDHFKQVKPYLNLIRKKLPDDNLIAGFLLNFVLSKSFIDKVVIGVNNVTQLKTNLNSFNKKSSNDMIEAPDVLDEILIPSLWPKN